MCEKCVKAWNLLQRLTAARDQLHEEYRYADKFALKANAEYVEALKNCKER